MPSGARFSLRVVLIGGAMQFRRQGLAPCSNSIADATTSFISTQPPSGGIFWPSKTEKNRVSVMRNFPRNSIKGLPMTDTDQDEITTLRTDKCPSLSGKSTLTYELGKDLKDQLHLRVTHNTGKGHHNRSWVAYVAVEPLLMQAPPLSASSLAKLFAGTSVNGAGFLMAVLKHLKVVMAVMDKRGAYEYVEAIDWKTQLLEPVPAARSAKDDKARGKRAVVALTP